ncbi:MAG: undecaprenyldiphospho-muramoylpentapeptide beta-N-acetylglucosaminyltransferase [Thermonemataceae bacterium]|nr:undecaprenyldiphospho-muramoylpentapeptide beta-N-acetylglucosaminyltransferase [Thermonemataceae bacterium]
MLTKRIIISGGGTGGHIYPAIANTLKKNYPATEILFVGAKNRMEMQKVPQAGYEIVGLNIAGIQRRLSVENLRFPAKLLASLQEAKNIIKNFKPDVCVGVGGYASGPTLYMASRMKIPTLIQEQNSYAGITNKLLARKAETICVAYPQMEKFFPEQKIVFTGNPVRSDIIAVEDKKIPALAHFALKENKKTLLAIGGSLGARTINESIRKSLPRIIDNDIQLIWQTGKNYYETAQKVVKEAGAEHLIKVFDFINVMDLAYAAAEVVISRAGALSISEICLVAKPAVLVPSPNVAEDHQTKNAQVLVQNKAALMVADKHAEAFLIGDAIDLLYDENLQNILKTNIQKFAKPNAAEEIVQAITKIW